jgi:hypothetical protein
MNESLWRDNLANAFLLPLRVVSVFYSCFNNKENASTQRKVYLPLFGVSDFVCCVAI